MNDLSEILSILNDELKYRRSHVDDMIRQNEQLTQEIALLKKELAHLRNGKEDS